MTNTNKTDWTSIDWWDGDDADPRAFTKGFRDYLYYAQPVMTKNGKTFSPREFRAGTVEAARKIIAASPEGRGHIVKWNERARRRDLIEDYTA